MSEVSLLWDIPQMPFMYTPLKQPTNGGNLPDRLGFSLGIEENTGRLMQLPKKEVSEALMEAYKRGSMISGQMDDAGIGRTYTDAFLDFVSAPTVMPNLNKKRVLEIGCGTGYLLYRIKELGAEVLGIEPGEHGQDKYEKMGVPILRAFFPSDQVTGTFDLIIIYGVLEHVEDPAGFMATLNDSLSDSGKVAIAVPDCEPYIKSGDVSMLIHEHWSYFTAETLRNTIASGGYGDISISHSEFGGFLYAVVGKKKGTPPVLSEIKKHKESARDFVDRATISNTRIAKYVHSVCNQGNKLGIYVPTRAINALIMENVPLDHCRFFDDNPLLYGTYYPGISQSIENKKDLMEKPVDQLLVMSHSFGDQIIAQLMPLLGDQTAFIGIEELLSTEELEEK